MTDTLVIQMPAEPTADAVWITVDALGAATTAPARGLLSDAAADAPAQVIALLPATQVLHLFSDIPLRGNAKIIQALPFALEEQLAQDVETLHFAISERNSEGKLPVAVVSSALIEAQLNELTSAGIYPTAVYGTADAVTAVPATTVLWICDNTIIIREPDGSANVSDPEELTTLLELKFPKTADGSDKASLSNILIYCSADQNTLHEECWDKLRARVQSIDIRIVTDSGIGKLAAGIVAKPGINLLQGKHVVRRDLFESWPIWRNAAILIVAAGLLSVASQTALVISLSQQEASLDKAASQTLQSAFPGTGDLPDPWGQLQSRLQGGSGQVDSGPDFIQALIVLADAVRNSKEITFEALNFRSGTIDLRLKAPAVENLDQLRQSINESGSFVAEIQSANPSDGVIKGRVQVKAKGT